MSSRTRQKRTSGCLAYLVVIVSLIFFVVPMLWIIYTSFRTQPAIFTGQRICRARRTDAGELHDHPVGNGFPALLPEHLHHRHAA